MSILNDLIEALSACNYDGSIKGKALSIEPLIFPQDYRKVRRISDSKTFDVWAEFMHPRKSTYVTVFEDRKFLDLEENEFEWID